ncbi:MAG: hypothetical protein AAF653_19725, partial [Chloroflexota bacterium]
MNVFTRLGISTRVGILAAILITITAATLSAISYVSTSGQLISNALDELDNATDVVAAQLVSSMDEHTDDVAFLSHEGIAVDYMAALSGTLPEEDMRSVRFIREQLENDFTEFIRAKGGIFQIRLIGTRGALAGDELVRVDLIDGEPTVIAQDALQNKGDTAYYQDTLNLPDRTIRYSEITLNRENGVISEPVTPTLRVSAPVYNQQGNQAAMIVINVDMEEEFDEMRDALGGRADRFSIFLVNDRGDYLVNSTDPSREFSFE